MSNQKTTRRGVLTLTGGALVALAGCGGSGGQEEATPTETEAEMTETEAEMTETATEEPADAMLRVAHLSPDAPNVDVAVDGSTVLEDVPFETVSDYLALTVGDHEVTVTPTGGDEAVFDDTVTLDEGLQTAAAIGEVAGDAQEFSLALFTEDDTLPESGETSVRAVHAIPDGPAVDVTAGDAVIADDLAFGEAGEYVAAPSDTSEVELRPESEENDEDPVGTFEVDLTDGAVQTAFATGYLEPGDDQPGAGLVLATDAEPASMEGSDMDSGSDNASSLDDNETMENGTMDNETMENESMGNESMGNETMDNETMDNETANTVDNESDDS
jgi:hypothetical protein